jgi:hypothetical protein
MGEVGKEADKAGKKLKEMADTPMGGLVANIGKIGKALAGLAGVGLVGAAINMVREWRDEWMAALEKVGKAEIDFQRNIRDAQKIDKAIPQRIARMEAEQRGESEHTITRKEELAAKDEEAAAIQKSIDDQVRMSAALNLAKNDLTGFMGSLKTIGAKSEKELEEFASMFTKEGGQGAEVNKRMLDLVQNFESPEMSGEMSRVRGEASVQAEAAARGLSVSTPSLEKHERAAQERLRDIAVAQKRLETVTKEKALIEKANALEGEILKNKADAAEAYAQATAQFSEQMSLAAQHEEEGAEARRLLSMSGREQDKEVARRSAKAYEESRRDMTMGRDVARILSPGQVGPRSGKETDEQRFARLQKQFEPRKIGDVVLTGMGKMSARDKAFMDAMRSQKNTALALEAANRAAQAMRELERDAAKAQIDTFREMQAMNRNLMANLQAK